MTRLSIQSHHKLLSVALKRGERKSCDILFDAFIFEELLDRHQNLTERDALFLSALENVTEDILERRCRANDLLGRQLYKFVEENNLKVVQVVLQKFPDLAVTNNIYLDSLLHYALKFEHYEIARCLLDMEQFQTNRTPFVDNQGQQNALTIACCTPDCPLDVIEKLLSLEFVDITDVDRALQVALVENRRIDIVDTLLAKFPELANNKNLYLVLKKDKNLEEFLELFLFKYKARLYCEPNPVEHTNCFHFAISRRISFKWLERILELQPGFIITDAEELGYFPVIMHAIFHDHFDLVKLLVDTYNVNINEKNFDRETPLYYCIKQVAYGNTSYKIFKWLLDNGADPRIKVRDNGLPLELALQLPHQTQTSNDMIKELFIRTYEPEYDRMREDFIHLFKCLLMAINSRLNMEVVTFLRETYYGAQTNALASIIQRLDVYFPLDLEVNRSLNLIAACLHELADFHEVSNCSCMQREFLDLVGKSIDAFLRDSRVERIELILEVANVLKQKGFSPEKFVPLYQFSLDHNFFLLPMTHPDSDTMEFRRIYRRIFTALDEMNFIGGNMVIENLLFYILNQNPEYERVQDFANNGLLTLQLKIVFEELRLWSVLKALPSPEMKLVKYYLDPSDFNRVYHGAEILSLKHHCRKAIRKHLYWNSVKYLKPHTDFWKVKMVEKYDNLPLPKCLKEFLRYQD